MEKHRFPEKNEGADTAWVWGLRGQKVVALPDHTFFIGVIHAKNTSPKRTRDPRWHQYSIEAICDLMQDDWTFYKSAFVGGSCG